MPQPKDWKDFKFKKFVTTVSQSPTQGEEGHGHSEA